MYFKDSVTVFWGPGVESVPQRAGSVLSVPKPSVLPSPSIPTLSTSALLIDLGLGNLEVRSCLGTKTGCGAWIQEMERGAEQRRADPGLAVGRPGAGGTKKCSPDNLTKAFSTSTLRVGFLMPKKEFNLFH